ncbi:MAG: hypothetical protein M3379_19130, partial [Acidobacteriota bacterium]|nr:hypothetical protein [Acidobacteriota bacterium]
PQTVQNVVTYNVVIDVGNPEQKLKPGMTANLSITIDERNDVLKVPNAALRFTPQSSEQSGNTWRGGSGNDGGSRRGAGRQSNGTGGAQAGGGGAGGAGSTNGANGADASGGAGDGASQQGAHTQFASSTSPVLAGQLRRVWVLGADGKPQPRRIRVGLTDGSSTEVVEGDLKEGDVVITGQTLSAASKSQNSNAQSAPPGFGGAPRFGGGGGGQRGGGR